MRWTWCSSPSCHPAFGMFLYSLFFLIYSTNQSYFLLSILERSLNVGSPLDGLYSKCLKQQNGT